MTCRETGQQVEVGSGHGNKAQQLPEDLPFRYQVS